MAWQELLTLLQGSGQESAESLVQRLMTKLDELLTLLESVEVSEKEKPGQALIRVEWRVAAFSLAALDDLERQSASSQRERLRGLRQKLQQTLATMQQSGRQLPVSDLVSIRASLIGARRELEQLAMSQREAVRVSRRNRNVLLLIPTLLGSLSVSYLRSERGLRLERIEAVAPSSAYIPVTVSDDTLYPKDEYLADYMTEFSKHYFGHPSEFPSLYFDRDDKGQPTSRRTLQHKISLRNASHGRVTYLSSVEAVVDVLETAEFPWNRLTVTPQVSAKQWRESDHRSLRVKSDGVGPAIDAEIVVTARSGLTVAKTERDVFHRSEIDPFASLVSDVLSVDQKSGALSAPRYWRLTTPPSTPGPQFFEVSAPQPGIPPAPGQCKPNRNEADYGWYEQITELSRLRALGPSGYAEPYQLQVSYASLKGEHKTLTLAGTLGTNEVFFAHHKRLLAYDPRCEHVDIDRDGIMDELDAGGPLAFLFASDKDLSFPKGVDLITVRLGIDLQSLVVGRRAAATHPLDGFLNPQGILAVNLTLHMPISARYGVRLLVNGTETARYRFAGLVPEHLSFEAEGHSQAVNRLRSVFGVKPKATK